MTYAVPLDLLDRYGDTELAQVADTDSALVDGPLLRATLQGDDRSAWGVEAQAAADRAAARIQKAIDDAVSQINSYLAGRYALPLDAPQVSASSLPIATADISRYNLWDDHATEEITRRRDNWFGWLRDLSNGRASLGTGDPQAQSGVRVNAAQGVSAHDWESY